MDFELKQLRDEALDSIDILFDGVFTELLAEGTEQELAGVVREMCVHFHTLASTTLLLDASPQYFFYNLCCAAENWRRLLAHLQEQAMEHPAASDNVMLLGAVVAEHWELARGICQLSAPHRSEDEYEDEFAWAHLLQALIVRPDGGTFPRELLDRYAGVLEELQPDRLELLRALLASDRRRFSDAFHRVHQAHEAETEAKVMGFGTSPDQFVAYRFIWFEGLALLRLAKRVGLELEGHFLYCPPLAQVSRTMEYDGDWVLPFQSRGV